MAPDRFQPSELRTFAHHLTCKSPPPIHIASRSTRRLSSDWPTTGAIRRPSVLPPPPSTVRNRTVLPLMCCVWLRCCGRLCSVTLSLPLPSSCFDSVVPPLLFSLAAGALYVCHSCCKSLYAEFPSKRKRKGSRKRKHVRL